MVFELECDSCACGVLFCLPTYIQVTGEATEKQILAALRRYPNRSSYMTEILRRLFHLSKGWTDKKFDVLQVHILKS